MSVIEDTQWTNCVATLGTYQGNRARYDALGILEERKRCVLKCQLCSPVTIDAKGTTLKGIETSLSKEPYDIEEKRIVYEDELQALGYVYFEQGSAISGGSVQTYIMGDPVRFRVEQTIRILNDSLFLCGTTVTVGYNNDGQLQELDVVRYIPGDTDEITNSFISSSNKKLSLFSDILVEGVGSQESFAAFCATPKLQSGRWVGEGTAIFPEESRTYAIKSLCKFVADVSGFGIISSEKVVEKEEFNYGLRLGKKDSEHAIVFQSAQGRTYEVRFLLLGGGVVVICPMKIPKDQSFCIEVSWWSMASLQLYN
ncbi:hypothetical protein Gasu_20050 isoform 2 [Galdieria sulphuraria]|uniref:Uncharacterized protein n=1 Tax=Galdieria sulphuraria TaxID=130081 RepID=M2Y4J6_GALSU|nr:hypothetical protein Gasu_20050 isoform 2 [Galdieria sulphuraria]EME30769.1 hypothetical protein isoform 2 [Galdieria sulphuraria]|eukprot:XP_005707289.1 hypothetical protein isoform 2 [Galdieria sulphuraria]